MLKTKVKVSSITNLTDARYFAAWGVDYLGFSIDPDSPEFVSPATAKEIIEWVEGPEAVLESSVFPDSIWLGNYQQVIADFYLECKENNTEVDFLVTSTLDFKGVDEEGFLIYAPGKKWTEIKSEFSRSEIKRLPQVFLDVDFGPDELEEILSHTFAGLVLRGGDEEKVGVKSYEDLDKIFDFLIE